jgi:hypothetical protein
MKISADKVQTMNGKNSNLCKTKDDEKKTLQIRDTNGESQKVLTEII